MKGRIISNELYTGLNQFSAAEKLPLSFQEKQACNTGCEHKDLLSGHDNETYVNTSFPALEMMIHQQTVLLFSFVFLFGIIRQK